MNRLRAGYSIERKGLFFKVVVPRRHARAIKLLKVIFTLAGLFSAYFTFNSLHVAFLFGLVIYCVSTILEKIIFSFSNILIHALPSFTLVPEKWLAMSFGYARPPEGGSDIPLIGLVFNDGEYAKQVSELLRSWNNGESVDKEQNIMASIITDGEDRYIFFCYSNPQKRSAEKLFEKVEKEHLKEAPTDEPMRHHVFLMLGKGCLVSPTSYFPQFKSRYRPGVPVLLECVVQSGANTVTRVPGSTSIVLSGLKIKKKADLDRKDVEFDIVDRYAV